MNRWNAEVSFAGLSGPPLKLRVQAPDPQDALEQAKGCVRNVLLGLEPAGGSEYTIGIFPPGYRAGDPSVLAEDVTLVTCPSP